MSTLVHRFELALARRGLAVALVLALVGVAALSGAWWLSAHPPTTQVTERTGETTVQTRLATNAVVTGEDSLYRSGRTLRNRSVYLTAATPNLTLVHETSVPADKPVSVDQRLSLVVEATRDETVFWSTRRTLVRRTTTTSDGRVTETHTLSIPALERRLSNRSARVGEAGTVQAHLVLRARYDTGRYAGTLRTTVPITLDDDFYSVPTTTVDETHATSVTRTTALDRPRWQVLLTGGGGALALLVGLAVGAAYLVEYRDRDPTAAERRLEHARLAEWISTGDLPQTEGKTVQMSTLAGLVDVAIDANRRVVHDEDADRYAVLTESVTYVFEWETGATDDAPDDGADGGPADETDFEMPLADEESP